MRNMNFLKKALCGGCVLLAGVCACFGQDVNPVLPSVEIAKVSYVDRTITLKVRYAPDTISGGVF